MLATLERRADPPEDPINMQEDDVSGEIDIGHMIEEARVARGQTRPDAAAEIGVSLRSLLRWVSGETRPHPLTYHLIARYLGCEVSDLMVRR